MKLLALDTSTDFASIALQCNDEVQCIEQPGQRQHAQLLLPLIQQLLAEGGIALSQLDGIVFGRGPGSFTGLRIACSIAKGLAYAHNLPLYPVSSLAAVAQHMLNEDGQILEKQALLVMLDARMNQVYWSCFEQKPINAQEFVSDCADIQLTTEKELILAGVGYHPYLDNLPLTLTKRICLQREIYPHAAAMLHLVKNGEIKAVSAEEALPVYIRNQVTQGANRG